MAAPGKQYGLILPKKLLQRPAFLPKHSAFADDSDEESTVGSRLQKEALKKKVMKQTKLEMQKALEQDATVYEYDSVYDELQKKKEENSSAQLAVKEKKPKYIQSLLQAVEVRKKEQEKRMEKKIQKEREDEGAEFEDKEAFVTSAYKKKLEERAEEEDLEKREAAIEASLDVTKQKDLSGFYRHLLNQTVGEEQAPECSLRDSRVKEEKPKGYSDESTPANPSPDEENGPKATVKEEKAPDADTHLGSTNEEVEEKVEAPKDVEEVPKKKEGRDSSASSEEDSKGHRSQRQSRSSSEEKGSHRADKHSQREPKKSHKKEKGEGGSSSKKERQHKDRDQDRRDRDQPEKERHRDKGERHKHSDHGSKAESRKRDEVEGRSRTKDKKEKDRKRDKDREDRHSERDRQKNGKDKERGEKYRERDEHTKEEKKERTDKDRKKCDEHKEGSPQSIRKERESVGEGEKIKEKESIQEGEKVTEKESAQEREITEKLSVQEKEKIVEKPSLQEVDMLDEESVVEHNKMVECKGGDQSTQESGSHLEGSPGLKHKEEEEEEEEEGVAKGGEQAEDSAENRNKFAKRCNEETVVSARDRYLARQMARVSTKSYIEKEED